MASLRKQGNTYYLQYYDANKKQKRINLETSSKQLAKDKLRSFESAQLRQEEKIIRFILDLHDEWEDSSERFCEQVEVPYATFRSWSKKNL